MILKIHGIYKYKTDVGLVKRKLAGLMSETVEVKERGQEWMLVTYTPFAVLSWTFTLGHQHLLVTSDGNILKVRVPVLR